MHFLLTLILQIAVILVVARAAGWMFRKVHQPQVVGEMAAGILLGPSLLGWVAPSVSAALFPPASLVHLNTLSQVGLLLFMFLVGLEFDPRLMRGRGRAAVVISQVSIVVPFSLGAALAVFLYPRLSDPSVGFTGFALFLGAAMSVTAFPVLARVLTERNLLQTRLGALTLACAAVDDVTAWALLAVVVVIVRADAVETPLWLTLCGTAVYVAVMLFAVRPALGRLEAAYHRRGRLTQDMIAVALLAMLGSAFTTEWLGIHALFGAFALGVVMPKDPGLVHDVTEKLEGLTVVFLLPLFFAYTGLRTQIGLVSGTEMWAYAALILVVAVAGKFGGSTLAARATGLGWREASALGVLMNTRGLMELVILTIGLELGVISPALFAMMVLMALVTTCMTTPLLELLYPARRIQEASLAEEVVATEFRVLLPIALPSSGPGLLDAALALVPAGRTARVYALHMQRAEDQSLTTIDAPGLPSQDPSLQAVIHHAAARGIEVRALTFTSHDIGADIVDVARVKAIDLVVMGWHKPVLGGSILSGVIPDVLAGCRAEVVVFVPRRPGPWRRVLVPYRSPQEDDAAVAVARRMAGVDVEVLDLAGAAQPLERAVQAARDHDLVVVGPSATWGTLAAPFGRRHEALAEVEGVSLLVVRGRSQRAPEAVAPLSLEVAGAET